VYLSLVTDWQAHRNAVFDIDWMPTENQLVTASGDQNIALWDVAAESSIATFRGHTGSVKTVRFMPSQNGPSYCVTFVQICSDSISGFELALSLTADVVQN